ncbi:MAG: thioesterase family protein [Bacteroidales bacterium]|jgi:acyl-CoA thioester hydrolase|nr:thioesterase family protein [Bacteroidales bacterium]
MGFIAKYTVGIGDINYGGHLGNDKALIIFHDARIRFLKHYGLSEINIGENKGVIMVDAQIKYLYQVALHDELSIEINIEIEGSKKFVVHYQVKNAKDQKPVISGSTGMLCFDYAVQKVKQIPESFVSLFDAKLT